MATEWYSEENLKRAWKYARLDSRDDFIFDVINYDDIRANLKYVISSLHAQIKANQYYPAPLIRIDVPKNFHSVRPGTVIPLVDLIVLYAIAQQLAPLLDAFLTESAYAYRLNPKSKKSGESLFKDWEEPKVDAETETPSQSTGESENDDLEIDFPYNWFLGWKDFHDLSKAASDEFKYVAVTDITAYFENISLDLLREILKEKLNTSERELIDRLFRLFELWDWKADGNLPQGIGLIQGNDVSSFLSNLYLIDLDDEMLSIVKDDHTKYFRYVDDVKLFTSDKDEARQALVKLEKVLRSLNLNVQSAKTEIVPANEIFDPKVEDWLERLDNSNPEKADAAVDFFENAFDPKNLDKWQRPYSRCLTVLRDANDARAVDVALGLFLTNPSHRLLIKNFRYLRHFATSYDYGEAIFGRLEEKVYTFPYHRAFIYRLAAYSRDNVASLLDIALKESLDYEAHWFCRASALFCASTFALTGENLAQISSLIDSEANPQVMRAGFVALLQHSGNELRFVLDKLTLFNAPHQDYLRRYFFRLFKDTKFSEKQLSQLKGVSLNAPRFVHSLYKFDLLKASSNPNNRSKFKNIIEKKIESCDSQGWTRLAERLKQIYDSFVVKPG